MTTERNRDRRLLKRYAAGESPQVIADSEGISRARLYVILNREALKSGVRDICKLRPKVKKVTIRPQRPPGKTVREAAKILRMSPQCVKQLCWKGRVPFAVKTDQWYLPARAMQFLKRFPHSRGVLGQQIAAKMRQQAAKLDPSCAGRQRQYEAA